MADDEVPTETPAGGTGFQLPDAPGDFSETVPNKATAKPGKMADPFTPLTPEQERTERARLNFQQGFRGTLAGSALAADAARGAEGFTPEEQAKMPGEIAGAQAAIGAELPAIDSGGINFDAAQETAKDELQKIQADQMAYKNMPAYHGVVEGAFSLAGQLGGMSLSPENLVFPQARIGSTAWRVAHPLISDMIGYGVAQGAIQGVANPIVQTNEIRAALRKEFDPVEASLAFPVGFAFGGGLAAITHGAAGLYRYSRDALEDYMIKGLRGPQLTPEVKPYVAPEPPRAPADTFEHGTQFVPAAPHEPLAVGVTPEAPTGSVRLYRAEGPGDDQAKHVLFSTTQFPGANQFIDLPAETAGLLTREGESLAVPQAIAAMREKMPVTPAAPARAPEGPSVFENLTDYDKAVRVKKGEEPQTFTEWVRSQGGLKSDPELKALYGRTKSDLVRKTGKSLDEIREAAVQQGRLDKDAGIDDVLRLLKDEDSGVKHYHPLETAKAQEIAAKRDPELRRVMDEVDVSLREIGEHPSQIGNKAKKAEAKDIRNRAIEIAHTEDVHPETAIERAMQEYGEHEAGAAGKAGRLVEEHPDIPFDTEATPRAGGRAGEAEPGVAPAANAPVDGGAHAAAVAEGRIAKRVKGMAGPGIAAPPGGTRLGADVASAHFIGPLRPVENLQDMMRRVSKDLELTVRKGVTEKGALGQYDFETHIARLNEMGPDGVVTWAHEVGHDIENRMGKPVVGLIAANEQSMRAFAGVMGRGLEGRELLSEGFGEFMAAYITNRPRLELIDPTFTKAFREMMAKENPALLKTLDDAHSSYLNYQNSPSDKAVASMIVTHGEVPKADPNDPLQRGATGRWLSNFYWNYVNRQHPMTIAFRYLAEQYEKKNGKLLDLRPDQDPRLLAQVLSDSGFQKTVMDLTYGIQNMRDLTPEGASYFSIMRRVTADPLTGTEVKSEAEFLERRKAFDAYLTSRWHLELRRQMSNGEIDLTRMPTGMTDGDAMKTVANMEQLHPEWQGLAQELYGVNKLIGKLEMENGLISAEMYAERMHPRNERYVPLYRDMRGISEQLGVGGEFRGDKNLENLGLYKRQGSGRNILSPTETIMTRLASINDAANQNMITRALRDLVQLVGGKEGALIAEMIPNAQLRALDVNVNDAVYKAAIAQGWMPDDAKSLVQGLQHELGPDIRTKLYRQESIKAGGRPIIFGWDNGERFAMRLPDGEFGRQLVEVMDSLGPKGMQAWAQAGGLVVDALTFSSSTLRAGATGTPTFMAKNLLRDAFMQFLTVPEAGVDTLAMANAIRGGRSYLMGDEFYRMYLSTGGIRGGVGAAGLSRSSQQVEFEKEVRRFADAGMDISKSKFSPKALQNARAEMADALGKEGVPAHQQIWFGDIKDLMQRLEISESAGRVGLFRTVYDANLAMGRDKRYAMYDAAAKARDFIDYGRMGSRMEMWSRMVPFLNANVQGIDKFMRTYVGSPSSPGMFFKPFTQQQADYQKALRTTLMPRVAALAAISAGITYAWEDDPVYQRLSVQQRSQNWIFRVPWLASGSYDMLGGGNVELPEGMQGAWVFIPKPWEPGTLFNFAEKAVEFLGSGGDTSHLTKALSSMRYTFSVPNPLELPLVRTSAGLASNYDDFFQRPIISSSLQGLAPHLQANEYTNKFYVALAQSLNMVWNSEDAHTWFRKNIPVVGSMLAAPWSPMEAQYLMQGAFGDWPRELGGIGGIGRSLLNGEMPNAQDIPALRAFVKTKMAMGEPMNELYNQIGQNGGRLTVANKTFSQLVKNGDQPAAQQYLNSLDETQRDYVYMHQVQAGPLANVLHPLDRSSALASVTRVLKNGLLTEGGLATLRDPNVRIKLENGKRDAIIQAVNEYTATEARNGLIVQGADGFKNLPVKDTKPYLDIINAISPEVGKDLSARLAQSKVMPIETIQRFWPDAQRALRVGSSADPTQLSRQIKAISERAAISGYEGGGRRSGRGAVDVSGQQVKRGKAAPVALPAVP